MARGLNIAVFMCDNVLTVDCCTSCFRCVYMIYLDGSSGRRAA